MNGIFLYDDAQARTFEPFALTRPLSELMAALRDALAARERIDGEAGHGSWRGLLFAAGADRRGTSCRRPRGEEPDKHATSLFEGPDDMTHTQDHPVS